MPPKPVVQTEILEFVRTHAEERGTTPTYQEIADNFGISRSTAFEHITALVRKGCLRKAPGKNRRLVYAKGVGQ